MYLPPAQVLTLTNMETPCIELEDRVIIAKFRDELCFQQNSTRALTKVLGSRCYKHLMRPPDFTKKCLALRFSPCQYEMAECLISNGADVKDSNFLSSFLKVGSSQICLDFYNTELAYVGNKQILTLETYNKLSAIGLYMIKDGFVIIDELDKRSRCIPPR